jgi:hypothetical protein
VDHRQEGYEERMMRRVRIVRKATARPRPPVEILALDPRDPDIVRAKALADRRRVSRPRTAV